MRMPDRTSDTYKEAVASSLRWDDKRDEPYLQLPSFPDLRLVPYRDGLAADIHTLFNHHVVGKRLFVLPYPMSQEYADHFVIRNMGDFKPILEQVATSVDRETLKPKPDSAPVLGFPFKCLWSVSQNRVVGDVLIFINNDDPTAPADATPMDSRPPGEQSWCVGYVVEPALHGRGIMSEVLSCMIEGWARPWMRVRELAAWIEFDNPGSIAVVTKHGFNLVHDEWTKWPEHNGGATRHSGYYVLKL